MEQTLNYEIFKSILSNREVDEKHVNRLCAAIRKQNLLHLNPIICNEKHEVVDGQHRLEAAKTLSVPIYFIVDSNVSKRDIATINSNSKNWSAMDYINYWTIEKKDGFDKLSSFISSNPMIAPSTAMYMLSSNLARNTKDYKDGYVDVSNFEKATQVATIIKYFFNLISWAYERNFVMAMITMTSHPDYDHEN